MRARGPRRSIYDPLRKGAAADALPAARARREAAAALGSAAGARDSQRPLLAAGRHLRHRGAVRRSPARSRRCRCRCRSAATVRRSRPGRCSRSRASDGRRRCGCRSTRTSSACAVPSNSSARSTSITITPIAVVDAGARPLVPVVLAAAQLSGRDRCTFTTSSSIPEPQGFWTIGGRSSQVTVAAPPGQTAPVVLRMHPGAKPNTRHRQHVRVERILRSGARARRSKSSCRSLPSGVVPLTIAAETGFYPRDIDPQSTDRRFLGVWVEVKTGPAATP